MGGLRGIVWLVLIAVAIRGLVPAGFMFAPDAIGGFQIVICTGSGSKLITLDETGNPIEDHHGADHSSPCIFCSSAPLMFAAFVALPMAGVRTASRIANVEARSFRLKSGVREQNFARGPPLALSV